MAIQLKPLDQQVMVITGASSGIGLATARAAAAKGAKLVLASRNKEALAEIERELSATGAHVIHVVADVGRREEVQQIADTAIRHFGGFDTWVNNAGVTIYGKLSEVSDEDHRRLFDTNFWGLVYGSLIAAQQLRKHGGTIINIGSVLSDVSIPLQGMYSTTKHAVKGFTDALRIELAEEDAPISVTLIKPSAINTPYTEHAKNYTGKVQTLPPPVYEPEEVAYAILHAAVHPQRDIMVGSGGKVMSNINKYAAGVMDWVSEKVMTDLQVRDRPSQHRHDSLYQPGKDGKAHGDYQGYVMKKSLYTRASLNPAITTAGAIAAVATGAAVYALMNTNRRKKVKNTLSDIAGTVSNKVARK